MLTNIISQNRLKKTLKYDPESGLFTWLTSTSNRVKVGQSAGTKHSMGYRSIKVDGRIYLAHRLAWFYVYGAWPKEIDHIDHNKTNNKIKNLRDTCHTDNMRNQKLRSTNNSGVMGVTWDKDRGKWQCRIRFNNKTIHIGRFYNIQDAIDARCKAEKEYFYHTNHGK